MASSTSHKLYTPLRHSSGTLQPRRGRQVDALESPVLSFCHQSSPTLDTTQNHVHPRDLRRAARETGWLTVRRFDARHLHLYRGHSSFYSAVRAMAVGEGWALCRFLPAQEDGRTTSTDPRESGK